jgi:tight adherence protein B
VSGILLYLLIGLLGGAALGGAVFAFAGSAGERTKKRMAAVSKPRGKALVAKAVTDTNQQRRKNVQVMLKELEKQQAVKKQRPSLRRRIEMAGLTISTRFYWIMSAISAVVVMATLILLGTNIFFSLLAGFAAGAGVPRWVLNFLKNRREKAFTREFATAIDIIVRSVKTGLPVGEAMKVVSTEVPEPVAGEFKLLLEGQKVGVPMEQGLNRMFERMPTAEVNFFGIVMTIQQKSGGNLSEALSNLASVLRDRKRLQGKIRAMSSEAKASAMIIGSLPPAVMALVYFTTPDYIKLLFTTPMGNIMLICCGLWMVTGVLVMKRMVSFKY